MNIQYKCNKISDWTQTITWFPYHYLIQRRFSRKPCKSSTRHGLELLRIPRFNIPSKISLSTKSVPSSHVTGGRCCFLLPCVCLFWASSRGPIYSRMVELNGRVSQRNGGKHLVWNLVDPHVQG